MPDPHCQYCCDHGYDERVYLSWHCTKCGSIIRDAEPEYDVLAAAADLIQYEREVSEGREVDPDWDRYYDALRDAIEKLRKVLDADMKKMLKRKEAEAVRD